MFSAVSIKPHDLFPLRNTFFTVLFRRKPSSSHLSDKVVSHNFNSLVRAAIKIPKMEGLIFLCLHVAAQNMVSVRAVLHLFLFTFYEHSVTWVPIHHLT